MSENQELLDDVFLQKEEIPEVERLRRFQLKTMQTRVNRAGNFLFAIGIITLLLPIFYKIHYAQTQEVWTNYALGAFYVGMGFLSNFKPALGLSLGLIVYVGLYLYTNNFHLLYNSGFIIRAFVVVILVTGIVNAFRVENFKTKYKM
jgi:hypothetical protein